MAPVYCNIGRNADMSAIVVPTHTLFLFQVNTTPTTSTILTDLVGSGGLANFSGYANVTMAFAAPGINGDGNSQANATAGVFTRGVGSVNNSIYGWGMFQTVAGTNTLVWAERFADAPRLMNTAGNSISITIILTQGGCP